MSRVIHFDLPADDPERAMSFYQDVFGWTFEKWDGPMDYWLISTGPEDEPGIDGGLSVRSDPEERTDTTIGVDSLDETLDEIKANGGVILREKSAVPGVGWLAYCQDTEGNSFGVMELDPSAG